MQYQSVIKGVPRQQQQRSDDEYWNLVHALMEAGWYRIGQDRDPAGTTWGFRSGHIVPSPARGGCRKTMPRPEERWIAARSELAAMRRLLRELPRASGPDAGQTPDALSPATADQQQSGAAEAPASAEEPTSSERS